MTPRSARIPATAQACGLDGEPVLGTSREPAAEVHLVLGAAEDLVVGRQHLHHTGGEICSCTLGDRSPSERTIASTIAPSASIFGSNDGHDSSRAQKVVEDAVSGLASPSSSMMALPLPESRC